MKKDYQSVCVTVLAVEVRDLIATSGGEITPITNPNQTEWDKKIGKIS